MNLAIPVNIGRDEKYDINAAYPDYISDAGYNPMLVNPGNNVKLIAELLDGLVLPGGIDIDPIPYGENNWGSYYCNPKKDKFERELMWAFMTAGKPIFGICRGFQLIAREYMFNAADTRFATVQNAVVGDSATGSVVVPHQVADTHQGMVFHFTVGSQPMGTQPACGVKTKPCK